MYIWKPLDSSVGHFWLTEMHISLLFNSITKTAENDGSLYKGWLFEPKGIYINEMTLRAYQSADNFHY